MIVKLKDKDKLLNLQIDYPSLFHTWQWLFDQQGFLQSDYMEQLMSFLFLAYRDEEGMRPKEKSNIFRPFVECSIDSCNMVVVTEYPYTSDRGNGLGIGLDALTPPYCYSAEMDLFKRAAEMNLYNGGMHLGFDYTLEEASDNGVLFLNSALTCTKNNKKAHVEYWERFIRFFLTKFQEATADKVFIFIGESKKFADEIDTKYHHVFIEEKSLSEYAEKKIPWETTVFAEAQEQLELISSFYARNPIL